MQDDSLFSTSLRYFVVLYQMRNYAETARAIPITYQGLKKAVQRLEHHLNITLFEHGPNSELVPTAHAVELYEQTLAWIKDANRLEERLTAASSSRRKTIRVGASDGIPGFMGYDMVESFEQQNPSLALDLAEYPDMVVDNALIDGTFDLALTVAPFNTAFETTLIAEMACCAWVNRNHRLAARKKVDPKDFNGESLIMLDTRVKIPEMLQGVLGNLSIQPRSVITCSEIIWIYIHALNGKGVGIGVDHIGAALGGYTEVISIPIDWGVSWSIGVSHRREHVLSDDERVVVDFLARQAAQRRAEMSLRR